MRDKKKVRGLTDEQRKRIMETPGVIVHERDPDASRVPYRPRIRLDSKIPIIAPELIDFEDGDWFSDLRPPSNSRFSSSGPATSIFSE